MAVYDLGRPLSTETPTSRTTRLPDGAAPAARRLRPRRRQLGLEGADHAGGHPARTSTRSVTSPSADGCTAGSPPTRRSAAAGSRSSGSRRCRRSSAEVSCSTSRAFAAGGAARRSRRHRGRSRETAAVTSGVEVGEGDAVLVRTGWGRPFRRRSRVRRARDRRARPRRVGRPVARRAATSPSRAPDTSPTSGSLPGQGHALLPVHRVAARRARDPDRRDARPRRARAADRVREFLFVLAPLKIVGATASPVRPLAVV